MKLFQIPEHNYDGMQTSEHSFRLAYKNEQLHCRHAALAAPVEHSCHLVVPAWERRLQKAQSLLNCLPKVSCNWEQGKEAKILNKSLKRN